MQQLECCGSCCCCCSAVAALWAAQLRLPFLARMIPAGACTKLADVQVRVPLQERLLLRATATARARRGANLGMEQNEKRKGNKAEMEAG